MGRISPSRRQNETFRFLVRQVNNDLGQRAVIVKLDPLNSRTVDRPGTTLVGPHQPPLIGQRHQARAEPLSLIEIEFQPRLESFTRFEGALNRGTPLGRWRLGAGVY